MARELILSLDGQETAVRLVKLDRERLYGEVEIEAFDEKGNEASIKVLAADGKTLIDKGGTALTTVNEEGESISRELRKIAAEPVALRSGRRGEGRGHGWISRGRAGPGAQDTPRVE